MRAGPLCSNTMIQSQPICLMTFRRLMGSICLSPTGSVDPYDPRKCVFCLIGLLGEDVRVDRAGDRGVPRDPMTRFRTSSVGSYILGQILRTKKLGTLSHKGAGQSAFLHSEGGVLAERRVLTLHLRSFVQIRHNPHSVPPFNQRWTRWSHLQRRVGRIPTSSTGTQPSSRRRSG